MELMLDTANLEEIRELLKLYPVSGITSNPTILKKEGKIDFAAHIGKLRELVGERSLHVQVTGSTGEQMVQEAKKICAIAGKETYIKIPVTEQGLQAIQVLHQQGLHITATAVYTSLQGALAAMAGANYVAFYYNRMQNLNIDAPKVVGALASLFGAEGSKSKLLGASFKNVSQMMAAFGAGAHAVTVAPSVLREGLAMPSIGQAVDSFYADWEEIHGKGSSILSV